MTSSFNFANQGRFEESIRINFEDDFYSIDCRWDRLVFLCEDEPSRFSKPNSTMKVFWEILEQLTQVPTFGALRQSLFAAYEINILELKHEEIVKKLKDKFFTSEIEKVMKQSNELAITLEKGSKEKQTTITFGPYTNEDNKKYNLFPFQGSSFDKTKGKFGTLLKFQVYEDLVKFDAELFKRYVDEQKDYSSHYLI